MATSPSIISKNNISYAINLTTVDNYWGRYPKQFASFAEYSEPGLSSEGVDDTGVTLRSFLPFNNQIDRGSVLEFHGIAPVFDTHCVCVRPRYTSLCFNITENGRSDVMTGQVSYPKPVPGRSPVTYLPLSKKIMDENPPSNFTCVIIAWRPGERTICVLKEEFENEIYPNLSGWVNDGLISAMDPIFDRPPNDYTKWGDDDSDFGLYMIPSTGNVYLVVEPSLHPGYFVKMEPSAGPWTNISLRNATGDKACPSSCWSSPTGSNCTNCVESSFRLSMRFDAFLSSIA